MKSPFSKITLAFFLAAFAFSFQSCFLLFDDELTPEDSFSLEVCDSISSGGGFFYELYISRDFNMNTSERERKDSLLFTEYETTWLLEHYDESAGEFVEAKANSPDFFVFDNQKKDNTSHRSNYTLRQECGEVGGSIFTSEKMYAKYTKPGLYRFSVTLKGTNRLKETKILHSASKEFECEALDSTE